MVTLLSRRKTICAMAMASSGFARSLRAKDLVRSFYPIGSVTYEAMFVAMGRNFIKDEGIDCKMLPAGDGVKTREIVASGQGDFGMGDFVHPLLLTSKGRPAKVLAGVDRFSTSLAFMLRAALAATGIDTVQKLAEWKRPNGSKAIIGVSSIGGTTHLWAQYYMETFGLANAVTWLGAGNVSTMLGSLRTKQIDVLVSDWALVQESISQGYAKLLFDGSDEKTWNQTIAGRVPVTVHYCLQSTVDRDPALVQAWTNAMLRALQWIHANSAEDIFDAIEPFVGSTSRDASIFGIKIVKAAVNPTGVIDKADFDRGSHVWFNSLTGVKPVAFDDIYAGDFIGKANEKYHV
ncbi:ABC transporter substrate-binding protein [Acidisphaera sp. L21]|uniref:ABC transporter substrate-binding protein n=1 Tax=Acidisphaera sp. L21 TaxID=1641851 RepID=UPI00131BD40D|nr:ABC transporter substrate-binding protein [Acidisphaera sp. L21]